jgi:hypothetical protein
MKTIPAVHPAPIGDTLDFVIGQGIKNVDDFAALVAFDASLRLFAELCADTDRLDVRPERAFAELIHAMEPGWTLRILQVYWPDEVPRLAFMEHARGWTNHATEGLDILHQGLLLFAEQHRPPLLRRTFLEFIYPGPQGTAWWGGGLRGACAMQGIQIKYLDSAQIVELARRILNPGME